MRLISQLCIASFAAVSYGMGNYDQDWITRVKLPLRMIDKIFGLLDFDPKG